MATDLNGATVAAGQQYVVAGIVREIVGDDVLLVMGRGADAIRVKAAVMMRAEALVDRAATRSFTAAPTSDVAATANGHLVRKLEYDVAYNLLISAFLGYLAGKQDLSANLNAIAAQSTVADRLTYWTGAGTAALTTLTSFARTILDDTSQSGVRSTIGAAAAAHSHEGTGVSLNDGWGGALAGSGIRNVQELADWLDANLTPP